MSGGGMIQIGMVLEVVVCVVFVVIFWRLALRMKPCPVCGGSGCYMGGTCSRCDGDGY